MDQDIAKSIAATLRHHGDEYHAQAVEKIASERDALESAERARKSLVRGDHFPATVHPEDTRIRAFERAIADMTMDDRFNTEET